VLNSVTYFWKYLTFLFVILTYFIPPFYGVDKHWQYEYIENCTWYEEASVKDKFLLHISLDALSLVTRKFSQRPMTKQHPIL